MSLDLPALNSLVARHGRVARILVAEVAGSAPREPGASMLVWATGAAGTIGGGALEFEAMARAREMLVAGQRAQARRIPLGPDLGQCCGGSVSLVWEAFEAATLPTTLPYARPVAASGLMPDRLARRVAALPAHHAPLLREGWLVESAPAPGRALWVWGAGHVGRALVSVMAPLPGWAIAWVDIADERFPDAVPAGVETLPAADPAILAAHAPDGAAHVIVTHSHQLDLALCDALLRRNAGEIGLIGSATKWARFRKRLAEAGHAPAAIARIACPIGDPSLGKHPQAIALGVATSLQRHSIRTDQRGTEHGARDTA